MVRIDAKIAQIQRDIDEELRKAINSTRTEYSVHLAKEQRLAADLDEQKKASLGFSSRMITYDALRREVDSLRNLYREASERLREIKLNQVSDINNVALVKRATIPLEPVSANMMVTMLASIALAGCVGVGCAFIREYFDNRFKEADELETLLQIPFLGMVPHYAQGKGRAYEPVSLRDPGSLAAEAYRILRTRLQATMPTMKSLLVTSALPSEGKSTTTTNLGIAFARVGWRVLLVDVDLRRPSLHRHFWVSNAEGLATVLVERGGWEYLIQDTPVETLKILPAGFNLHNPSDLLSLNSTKKLFEEFKQHFDLVIFDAPIVLSIPDVEIIAPWMDGVVLVHSPERCDKSSVLSAKSLLDRVGATVTGAVFNNIRRQDQRYYSQQRTYYSQNLYGGTEQYDLDLSTVRQLDAGESEVSRNGHGLMDDRSHPVKGDDEGDDLIVGLDKVIVNDSIADAHADATRTFLILELSLKNASLQTNDVAFFRPEAAVVRLDHGPEAGAHVVSCDVLTEQIRNGLQGEVAVRANEVKKGMIVYRVPRGIDKCVFEYGHQRVDITLGF
jgi:capsular exopolysaccharide synthesis family protein